MFVFVKYAFARLCPDKSAPLKSTLSPIMYPFLRLYFGFKYGVVPLTPPVLIFTKPEFIMFAFVIVTLLKSIPLKSLFDRSTPGPIMYPPRNENVLSGKMGSAGEATIFPDFIFRSFELVKSTPVKFVPLKSWSVKSFFVKFAYGPIKYPDTNLKPDPVENTGRTSLSIAQFPDLMPTRFAPVRFVPVTFAYPRFDPRRSAPLRSAYGPTMAPNPAIVL